MNCDQAFDQMTDPGLESHEALERHLRACPRCRQMRETLAPALENFGIDHTSTMTTREFDANEDDVVRVAQEAAALLVSHPKTRKKSRRLASWRHTGVLLLVGTALLVAFSGLALESQGPHAPAAAIASAADCTWTHPPEPGTATSDSRTVVLSCVACHLGSSSQ